MNWSYILEIILKAVGSVGAAVITGLAGWLFTKLSAKIKDSRIQSFVNQAVKAAEQLYPNLGTKTGPEKLKYVTDLVKQKWPKLDNAYIDAIIEGAVFTLNNQLEEAKKKKEATPKTIPTKVEIGKVEDVDKPKTTNSIESSGIQVD